MGIPGLLQLLKPVTVPVSIKALAGKTVAIDAYSWLHKGAYGCPMELVEGRDTNVYIKYCMKRLGMLIHHKVKPYVVFDGGYLPSKAGKEDEREARRTQYKSKGMAFLRAGNKKAAMDCFQKCVDITPEMALKLVESCKDAGVRACLAYLV